MKTFDRYIVTRVLWPLAATLSIALFALLLARLARLLDLFVNRGGSLSLVLQALTNLIPFYLGIALPAAFFVAVLVAVMRLSQTSEVGALQAAGVGLWRLVAPIMGLAIVLTLGSAVLVNYLQPYARYAYRAVTFALAHQAWNATVESGAFFTGFADTTVLVDGLDRDGTTLVGIFAYRREPAGRSVVITAAKGSLRATADRRRLFLHFGDGVRVRSGAAAAAPSTVRFERLDLPLDLGAAAERFHGRGRDEEELTLSELWAVRDSPPAGTTVALVGAEIAYRLVQTLSVLVLPFLAVPLGIASPRERKGLALGAGLVVLVLYHHVLQLGHSFAGAGRISPALGLWLPFALFAAANLWTFVESGRRPEGNPLSKVLARLEGALRLKRGRPGWQRGAG